MAALILHSKPLRYLSKNQSIKLFKQKQKRRDEYACRRNELKQQYDQIDSTKIQKFSDFPLTRETQNGLRNCSYVEPTEIQLETIGLALKGHDILGAAKTGSGKTVAFVVPVLERLFQEGWCKTDGLGVLIITPTRELAMQIHEVSEAIGKKHDFTIGLVIGGKDLQTERRILNLYNIVICTPGRLLQHMDQNPLFDAMNLQMLVLDEADRILDLGFQREINAILENLPETRQTLLFSATQTKSVKDLARLSLKDPMYVSVHEHAEHATPETLQQSYIVCELSKKIDFLWSFIKSHQKQKILVFMATCKQVKFVFDLLCRLKPGVSLMSLYGDLHQMKRMERYKSFCTKIHAVMLATDLAARGLDFPNVNWVVQLDCPEDVNTYIHRAGRTARYKTGGEALLVLLPSEKQSMSKQLEDRKIPIKEIRVHPKKIMSVQRKTEALCARDTNLKESAQRAFKSYYKNIFLMKDKSVFDIKELNNESVMEEYAKSLGLALAPRIRFIQKHTKNTKKRESEQPVSEDSRSNAKESESDEKLDSRDSGSDSDDFLKPKGSPIIHQSSDDEDNNSDIELEQKGELLQKNRKVITKAALAKKILKKNIKPNVKVVFNKDGEMIQEVNRQLSNDLSNRIAREMLNDGYNVEKAKLILNEEDQVDKELYRNKIKQKHKDMRLKLKGQRKEQHENKSVLGIPEGDKDEEDENEENSSESDEVVDPNNMPESSSSEEESSEDSQSDNEPSDLVKRKRPENKNEEIKWNKKSKLSLDEDEDLALHYLQNA